MCGRYFLNLDFEQLLKLYDFVEEMVPLAFQTGEIYPSQSAVVVKPRKLSVMRWGMKYDFMKRELINGRSETLGDKRLFKEAFLQRRVIIPASAYFEWEKDGLKKVKRKIGLKDQSIISLAGIFNTLRLGDEWVESFVILTQAAAGEIGHIHDRMPLIIPRGLEEEWLNTNHPQWFMDELHTKQSYVLHVE